MPSYDVRALREEWAAMCEHCKKDPELVFDQGRTRGGATVYRVRCANGEHWSIESPAHAMFLLVDSHRTRYEDTLVCHQRLLSWGKRDVREARKWAARIGAEVRDAHPDATVEEHGRFVLAYIEQREAEREAAPDAPPRPGLGR